MISTKISCLTAIIVSGSIAFATGQSLSPDVISSSGEFFTSASGSISYTIGEPVSETFSTGSNILTQGFQQPRVLVVTGIPDVIGTESAFIYPNPVKEDVFIDFTKMKLGNYTIQIYDVSGKQVNISTVEIAASVFQQKMSFANYDNGIYLIKITNNENALIKTFKIIKQN